MFGVLNGAPLKEISAQPRSSTKIIITFGFFTSAKELKLIKAIIVIYLIGVLAEVIGVRYNIIFGKRLNMNISIIYFNFQ